MEKKENKKLPRQEIIDNPIPTSLFYNQYTYTSVPIYPKIASPIYSQTTEQLHTT